MNNEEQKARLKELYRYRRKNSRYRWIWDCMPIFLILFLLLAGVFVGGYFLGKKHPKDIVSKQDTPKEQDYVAKSTVNYNENNAYPLEQAMLAAGYETTGDNTYQKVDSTVTITIRYDFAAETCTKNQYTFSLEHAYLKTEDGYYIDGEAFANIVNYTLSYDENNQILASKMTGYNSDWYAKHMMVTHAMGAVREAKYNTCYTNSKEALLQNINLGARIFEVDFGFSTDEQLTVVHNWKRNAGGARMSLEEYLSRKIMGTPVTASNFTPMTVEELLEAMVVNKDMVIITDTKSSQYTNEEAKAQIQQLITKANALDPDLILRIVPQVYDKKSYKLLEEVYHFQNVIFTAYNTDMTGDQILKYVTSKDNIKVITAPDGDERFDEAHIQALHESGLYLYNNTINDYDFYTELRGIGVDGVYTDLLLQDSVDIYENSIQ